MIAKKVVPCLGVLLGQYLISEDVEAVRIESNGPNCMGFNLSENFSFRTHLLTLIQNQNYILLY